MLEERYILARERLQELRKLLWKRNIRSILQNMHGFCFWYAILLKREGRESKEELPWKNCGKKITDCMRIFCLRIMNTATPTRLMRQSALKSRMERSSAYWQPKCKAQFLLHLNKM